MSSDDRRGSGGGEPGGRPAGREARLRPEHAALYPGLQPGAWTPIGAVLNHVMTLLERERERAREIGGERLLREEHFEFRGASVRPEGWPEGLTRLSDAAAEPPPSGPAPWEVRSPVEGGGA